MSYRPYNPPSPRLIGYDPFYDLPRDHLARLVEIVVEESIGPPKGTRGPSQPAFDPRLCVKVLTYGYATGVRSSRQLEKLCDESLPYLFLTRGDTPSYRTLCSVRVERPDRRARQTSPSANSRSRGSGKRMEQRAREALKCIDEAEAEGRKPMCLTDPDARMMYGAWRRRCVNVTVLRWRLTAIADYCWQEM